MNISVQFCFYFDFILYFQISLDWTTLNPELWICVKTYTSPCNTSIFSNHLMKILNSEMFIIWSGEINTKFYLIITISWIQDGCQSYLATLMIWDKLWLTCKLYVNDFQSSHTWTKFEDFGWATVNSHRSLHSFKHPIRMHILTLNSIREFHL